MEDDKIPVNIMKTSDGVLVEKNYIIAFLNGLLQSKQK
jgi:hypothetical protein